MRHCAIPKRRGISAGNREVIVAAVDAEGAANARIYESTCSVVFATDGAIMAKRHIVEDQAHGLTRRITCRRRDSPTHACSDELVTDAVSPVAIAAAGLVVLEEAIGDRGGA